MAVSIGLLDIGAPLLELQTGASRKIDHGPFKYVIIGQRPASAEPDRPLVGAHQGDDPGHQISWAGRAIDPATSLAIRVRWRGG